MRRTTIAALVAIAAALLPAQVAAADSAGGPPAPTDSATPSPVTPASPPPTDTAAPPVPAQTQLAAGPGPVRRIGWTSVRGAARLTWQAPEGAPDGTTYTVVVQRPGTADETRSTGALEVVLTPVAVGTRLTASVTATAAGMPGTETMAPAFTMPATPPGPPASVSLLAEGAGALRAGWTPPAEADGQEPTGYLIALHTAADPAVVAIRRTAGASERTLVLTGLDPRTRYFATVAAVGNAGTGAERESATALPGAAPATACAACAATGAPEASVAPAPPSGVAATSAPRIGAATGPAAQVPTSSGTPLRIGLAIGGTVLAAVLAITALLLRRRSAVG